MNTTPPLIALDKQILTLIPRTINTLQQHFANDPTITKSLKDIADTIRDPNEAKIAIVNLIELCEAHGDSIAHLFSYDSNPLTAEGIKGFAHTKPLGLCQKTLDEYKSQSNWSDQDKSKLITQKIDAPVKANFDKRIEYTWIPTTNDIDISIDELLTKLDNTSTIDLITKIWRIPFWETAKLFMSDTITAILEDIVMQWAISDETNSEYEIVTKAYDDSVWDWSIEVFNNNITYLKDKEKELFDYIFFGYDDESYTNSLANLWEEKLETKIESVRQLVQAIGFLKRKDSLSILMQAIITGQLVSDGINDTTYLMRNKEERVTLLSMD